MQLKLATDHAICTLLYLSKTNSTCTAQEISSEMHISLNYLRSTILNLRDAGLVSTHNGRIGGCRLLKSPKEITLYDVISIMEGTIKINRCLEDDGYWSRDAADYCPVHQYYQSIQDLLENKLKSVTIADILHQ